MDTVKALDDYLHRRVDLAHFYAALQAIPSTEIRDDPLAAEARRLVGEATSAGWSEDQLRDSLARLTVTYWQDAHIFAVDAAESTAGFDMSLISVGDRPEGEPAPA